MEDLLAPLFRKHDPTSTDDPSSKDPPKIEGFEWIRNGTFTMGSSSNSDFYANPPHQVMLTNGFYMGKYEVTQSQWLAVMTGNTNGINDAPSIFTTAPTGENLANLPVENVTWYDVLVFCNRLSMQEGLTPVYTISGSTNPDAWLAVPDSSSHANRDAYDAVIPNWNANGYRLPTEAEWEYACRAGTETAYNTGDIISNDTGWYDANSSSSTHEVGLKQANVWGFCDMHGNVLEWCWDWYGVYALGGNLETDPTGPSGPATDRVMRGGSWYHNADHFRSACRNYGVPWIGDGKVGFRVVRSE